MRLSRGEVQFSVSAISSLPRTFFDVLPELEQGGISRVHIDVMDGSFVPRFGLYPEFVEEVRSITKLPIDVHMMLENPEDYVHTFVRAGATRIVPHVEPVAHAHRLLMAILDSGAEAGVALNPLTSAEPLKYVIPELSAVTLMAINPGIVGHREIPFSTKRVGETRKLLDDSGFFGQLEVDGGVTFENIGRNFEGGADLLVVGAGTVFHRGGSVAGNLEKLRLAKTAATRR